MTSAQVTIQWRLKNPTSPIFNFAPESDRRWTPYKTVSKKRARSLMRQGQQDPVFEYRLKP